MSQSHFLNLIGITAAKPRGWFRRWLNIVGATLAGTFVLLVCYGLRSWTYAAKDYDPGLTHMAKGALPIISALASFQSTNGKFPDKAKDLPTGIKWTPREPDGDSGWNYYQESTGKGYGLGLRVTHDSWLYYHFDSVKGTWTYEDSGQTTEILLSP